MKEELTSKCEHIECLNKVWVLEESKSDKIWKTTPYVKDFNCLAEARKALIYYSKNEDFKDIQFRLRLLK